MRFRNTYRHETKLLANQNRLDRREAFAQSVSADIERTLTAERNREWRVRREVSSAIADIANTSLESRCSSASRDFNDIARRQQYDMSDFLAQEEYRRREVALSRRRMTQGELQQ